LPSTSTSFKRTRTLSTIRECSDRSVTDSPNIFLPTTPSLRRRRARLLRTPSVERQFPGAATQISLQAGSPESDSSEFSSSESSQSHSSRTNDSIINTPPTSTEDGSLLFKIEAPSTPALYDRPDSMSSYATARSNFSFD